VKEQLGAFPWRAVIAIWFIAVASAAVLALVKAPVIAALAVIAVLAAVLGVVLARSWPQA
jgi:hypothetical protein